MNQPQHIIRAAVETAPAIIPGAATVAADWLGLINTGVSILFLTMSSGFLAWRWYLAYTKEKANRGD